MYHEFNNLLAIKDSYPKYVITMDYFTNESFEGIAHLLLRLFLSEWNMIVLIFKTIIKLTITKTASLMKTSLLFLFLFCISSILDAQNNKPNTLTISGKIDNFNSKFIFLQYLDDNYMQAKDTILVESDGTFRFQTTKITNPKCANLFGKEIYIQNVFIAPGFDLKITGDAKDWKQFILTKKIAGLGANANAFQTKIDSIMIRSNDTINHISLGADHYFKYVDSQIRLTDSIAKAIFTNTNTEDQNILYFKKAVSQNLSLTSLIRRLDFLLMRGFAEAGDVVKGNDSIFSSHKNIDNYLNCNDFSYAINRYTGYCLDNDFKNDPSLEKKDGYKYEKISNLFSGKTRDFAMYNAVSQEMYFLKNMDQLIHLKAITQKYIDKIENHEYKLSLERNFNKNAIVLSLAQVGKDAPAFSLKDKDGASFKLENFKGKLICLDLWASWCTPCRLETPYFQKLVDKYKNDKRVEFISISFDSDLDKWKKAIEKDKPTWLQLIDDQKSMQNAYAAYEIPRFILIDKNGKILNFDAPKPSDADQLTKILDGELNK